MATRDDSQAKDGDLIRLFLCDDAAAFRALMREVLADGEFVVVGEAGDGAAIVQGVVETRADVVLLDLAMPHSDGITAIDDLRRGAPHCAVVVFSGFASTVMAQQCLDRGAHAYVEKGTPMEQVRGVIRRAHRDQRARSTSTGAWSEGLDPLRKSRNIV